MSELNKFRDIYRAWEKVRNNPKIIRKPKNYRIPPLSQIYKENPKIIGFPSFPNL